MKANNPFLKFTFLVPLLYFAIIFCGCWDSSVDGDNVSLENGYLFVECSVITDAGSKNINITYYRDGYNYVFDKEDYVLTVISQSDLNKKVNSTDKFIIGKRRDLSKNIGGGLLSDITGLVSFSMVDTLSNEPFSHGQRIELVGCDKKGNIQIKLNDRIISLQPRESFTDSMRVNDCVVRGKCEYTNIKDYVTITNYGFMSKKNVKYSWE
jgi:hypothetical protein